ncbi:MAG: hypothetical protein K8U57_22515 [Planctomycetes bacterium]|nr:hypothetical protein [Planctomycetota bacterium]
MPALFFPNLNALRIALASGLVPVEISQSPADAGFDVHGRLWLEPTESLPREALAALARVGVQALGDAGVQTTPISCWAELLPLQADAERPLGPVLFLVPEKQLARFTAKLRRASRSSFGVLLPDLGDGVGWVTVAQPPAELLTEASEPTCAFEALVEQAPSVWVRHGWRHQVPEHLAIPEGCVLFVRPPRSVVARPCDVPLAEADEFGLASVQAEPTEAPPLAPPVAVRLTLGVRTTSERESLWVLDAAQESEFWASCVSAAASLTARLEATLAGAGSETRLVVRVAGKRLATTLPFPVSGYCPDPRVPGLFVPVDRIVRPTLRVRELGRTLGTKPGWIVWLETGPDGGVVPNSVAESAFRPVQDLLEYHAPAVTTLAAIPRTDLFPLARFVVANDLVPIPEAQPKPQPVRVEEELEELPEIEVSEEPNWIRRALRNLVAKLRPTREQETTEEPQPDDHPQLHPTGERVERKLASPDALLHGHDWTARRQNLEARLFTDLPKLGPAGRAERWSELAGVYSAIGNSTDAAVCWMNAVWESSTPSGNWLEQWFMAESRAAKLTDTAGGLERWLSEPGRAGVGRVVAAYTAAVGMTPNPPPEFLAALPRLHAFLDLHFDDVPVRAAWLARYATARVCDGDALGLARWRDRVLARLAERGPGLDLDEPSFLRFHGTASAERFQAAREWVLGVRDRVMAWVEKLASGKLRWAGLDAETDCTAAYAQFMLAWGLACLGERTKAKQWAGLARKIVSRVTGPGVDASAHAVLGDLFLLRVRDAQEGRTAKPGLPPEIQTRLEALPELARYAVERLREHCRILEPVDRVRAFRGLDLKAFWGNDELGERLFVLTSRNDRGHLAEEANELLRLCTENPSTETVPRIVFTLLDLAPWLDRPALPRVLDLLPTAVDWTEAWLSTGKWTEAERPNRLLRYQTRMLATGFSAAATLDPTSAGLVSELVRRLMSSGDRLRGPLLATSGQVFRVLRQLGLSGTAETLVKFLDPGQSGVRRDPARVGLAGGWYAAGNEDAGNRILDEARERLFLGSGADSRIRTPLAVAYAEALGFAPARIAHGRLEEIFQRLGPVEVMGSTNSYFTLRPLQLIDAVIRSVVTDEFALGPSVRGWLDDDEFLIRGRIHRDLAAVLREQDIR